MQTEIVAVDPHEPDPRVIERAAELLRAGALVAFPTETVYGLGALADDEAAIEKIYQAKGRPSYNPLIAHVPDAHVGRTLAAAWPDVAEALAQRFWPGPLTLVVSRGPKLPLRLTAGLDKAALRAPQHPVALALLRAVGRPIAAPSANPSTMLSPTRAEHVRKGLAGRVALVLDAGPCALGIESTVLDVTVSPPRVLRPGALSSAELRAAFPGIFTGETQEIPRGVSRASPGLDERHYAPRARLVVTRAEHLDSALAVALHPVGLLVRAQDHRFAGARFAQTRVLADDAQGYAAQLFDALHALDDAGCSTVLVVDPPRDEAWVAVHDRLRRASTLA